MAKRNKQSKSKELKSPVQKMNGNSYNPQAELLELLKSKCPEAFTEGKIDCKKLQQTLGGEVSADGERYGLSWAGKADCFRHIQEPTTATLKPVHKESVDFDNTENIFIEGDNLQVLKVLQKSYYGKVKMIYIDPPYNTGNDSFIYPDRFAESQEQYLKRIGDKDVEGNLIKDGFLRKNTKESGHFHSNWMSMMYPRLFLARNLLTKEGVIAVSTDDNEVFNLRAILNEIFFEENFLAELVWDLGTGTAAGHFTRAHEYILVYAKSKNSLPNFKYDGDTELISERAVKKISKGNPPSQISFPVGVKFEGTDATFEGEIGTREKIKIIDDSMIFKDGLLAQPVTLEAGWAMRNQILSWLDGEETYDTKGQKVISFYFNKDGRLQYEKERGFVNPQSVLRNIASTRKGSIEIENLFGKKVIDYPKPVDLMNFLIELICDKDEIVLDFFAGSCSTAHSIMSLNSKRPRNLQYICVQLAEPCDPDKDVGRNAISLGLNTVADIGKERIRRAAKKIAKEKEGKLNFDKTTLDLGFKVLKLSESNFKIWRSDVKTASELEKQMGLFVDNVKSKATQGNILYELILKSGLDLNVPIEKKKSNGKQYFLVDEGNLIICLEDKLTQKLVDTILKIKPKKCICLDKAFSGNDQLKTNTALQMETEKIEFKVV